MSSHILLLFGSAVAIVAFTSMLMIRARIERETRAMRVQIEEETSRKQSAEAANQVKAEFLASISQEVRTPMNSIVGSVESSLKKEWNPELSEHLNTARTSAKWLMQIVNHVFEFSRIEAGSLQLEDVKFGLSEAIQSAIQIVQPDATAKNLTIRCKIDKKIPLTLRGDPTRLCQVVLNLVENAVQYTISGGAIITAALESESEAGLLVRVCVTDTGIGIPPDKQKQIFEPFSSQCASGAKKVGLGLALTRRIVELMGGTIEVTSQLGAGSTFQFTACFQRAEEPETPEKQKREDGLHFIEVATGREAIDDMKLEPVRAA
ncbi:MAG: hypothetical protein JO138_14985 [Acidobacteriaceae bacterium]|nr:hypothetical protein [Acidobacteriaceae bacterium]